MGDFVTDYIKSIENPDRIGWNGKVWGAPTLKGYDANQRGYGIDIRYNNAAKNLVKNRKGLWLTDKEVTDLMNLHLLYITGVAKRKIKGFNTFSPKKQAAILGMLYRGDSVQSNVNVNEPNDTKFLNAVHTYYKNKGLNQRMLNSINFFSKYKLGGKMNIIEKFKKGYKIKIKESQKGSFTKYCNGKVTNECIQRGKNSPDPKIRKKATFADNARHFKHAKGGIIKAEDGISTSLLELLPVYGTYKDYERFKENPNWKTGASLGISALGDAATLTGIGTIIKGVSAANKAKKVLGTAGKAANIARLNVWKAASKFKRESDAVNSLTLMDAPINKILERQTSKNLALLNYKQALKNDENALKFYLNAGNNPAFNFKISEFAPLIYTNPGFHAASLIVQSHKKGGQLIKAEEGTKFLSKQWFQNAGQKVNNFLSSDAGKFAINAGKQIYSNINSGVKLAETKDRLQKWKQAYVNSIEPKDFSLQVAEEERLIKLANPDYNISPIVSAYKENILATQAANKAKQKASLEADLIIMLLLLNLNESSTGGGFGSLLTEGLGLAGQFLSSKKSNNTGTNTGTTNLSTYKWTLNGSPSTYTPSQNTSNVYSGFNLTTPVLPTPTIPIKYNNFTL